VNRTIRITLRKRINRKEGIMINDFHYLKPASVKEALAMYAEHDDCKVICGGQSLLIVMRQGMVAPNTSLTSRA
jgi:hypothetical protein